MANNITIHLGGYFQKSDFYDSKYYTNEQLKNYRDKKSQTISARFNFFGRSGSTSKKTSLNRSISKSYGRVNPVFHRSRSYFNISLDLDSVVFNSDLSMNTRKINKG